MPLFSGAQEVLDAVLCSPTEYFIGLYIFTIHHCAVYQSVLDRIMDVEEGHLRVAMWISVLYYPELRTTM